MPGSGLGFCLVREKQKLDLVATPVQFSHLFVGFEAFWDAKEPWPSWRNERRRKRKRDAQCVCGRGQFPLIYTFTCSGKKYLLTRSSLKASESYVWREDIFLPFFLILLTKYKKENAVCYKEMGKSYKIIRSKKNFVLFLRK